MSLLKTLLWLPFIPKIKSGAFTIASETLQLLKFDLACFLPVYLSHPSYTSSSLDTVSSPLLGFTYAVPLFRILFHLLGSVFFALSFMRSQPDRHLRGNFCVYEYVCVSMCQSVCEYVRVSVCV